MYNLRLFTGLRHVFVKAPNINNRTIIAAITTAIIIMLLTGRDESMPSFVEFVD